MPLGVSRMAAMASRLIWVGATGVRPSRHGSSSLEGSSTWQVVSGEGGEYIGGRGS